MQNVTDSQSAAVKKGVLLVIAAYFIGASQALFSKVLVETLPIVEVSFFRFFLGFLFLFGFHVFRGSARLLIPKHRLGMHLGRTIPGIASNILLLYALDSLTLAEHSAIGYFNPLLMTVLAWIFLKERVPRLRWLAIVLGFIGVLLVAKPTSAVFSLGAMPRLLAATCAAISCLFLRVLRRDNEPSETIVGFFFLCGALVLLPIVPFFWQTPTTQEMIAISLFSASGMAFHMIYTAAFGYLTPSMIAPLSYTSLLWALVFDATLWGTYPDAIGLLGVFLVMSDAWLVILSFRSSRYGSKNSSLLR